MKNNTGTGGTGWGSNGRVIVKFNAQQRIGNGGPGGSGGSGGAGSFLMTDGTGFVKWKRMPVGLSDEELKLWKLLYSDDHT